jgi:hypothetical protein
MGNQLIFRNFCFTFKVTDAKAKYNDFIFLLISNTYVHFHESHLVMNQT